MTLCACLPSSWSSTYLNVFLPPFSPVYRKLPHKSPANRTSKYYANRGWRWCSIMMMLIQLLICYHICPAPCFTFLQPPLQFWCRHFALYCSIDGLWSRDYDCMSELVGRSIILQQIVFYGSAEHSIISDVAYYKRGLSFRQNKKTAISSGVQWTMAGIANLLNTAIYWLSIWICFRRDNVEWAARSLDTRLSLSDAIVMLLWWDVSDVAFVRYVADGWQ